MMHTTDGYLQCLNDPFTGKRQHDKKEESVGKKCAACMVRKMREYIEGETDDSINQRRMPTRGRCPVHRARTDTTTNSPLFDGCWNLLLHVCRKLYHDLNKAGRIHR